MTWIDIARPKNLAPLTAAALLLACGCKKKPAEPPAEPAVQETAAIQPAEPGVQPQEEVFTPLEAYYPPTPNQTPAPASTPASTPAPAPAPAKAAAQTPTPASPPPEFPRDASGKPIPPPPPVRPNDY
jgi:hypothetical protein